MSQSAYSRQLDGWIGRKLKKYYKRMTSKWRRKQKDLKQNRYSGWSY